MRYLTPLTDWAPSPGGRLHVHSHNGNTKALGDPGCCQREKKKKKKITRCHPSEPDSWAVADSHHGRWPSAKVKSLIPEWDLCLPISSSLLQVLLENSSPSSRGPKEKQRQDKLYGMSEGPSRRCSQAWGRDVRGHPVKPFSWSRTVTTTKSRQQPGLAKSYTPPRGVSESAQGDLLCWWCTAFLVSHQHAAWALCLEHISKRNSSR